MKEQCERYLSCPFGHDYISLLVISSTFQFFLLLYLHTKCLDYT